jgi:tetratricopeptide (TPR) repeat protein/tRNA A-37 threonylcarbamoyl transferase component Bud32
MRAERGDILEPGMVLFGHKILEFVGEGGWSYVYKAQHPELPLLVAIKQLKPELVKHENALQRFLREANIVARLRHPNVVTIYGLKHDEKAERHYIITEFAERGTLRDRLEEHPNGLPDDDILHLAMGICSGLEIVHQRGIIHRDIKPGNILLFDSIKGQDIPKLSDFGIAEATAIAEIEVGQEVRKGSGVYGSIHYMSPEQFDDKIAVDHRSDLYSLGVLLYELLTGRVPFTGEVQDIIEAHTWLSPRPLRDLRPYISEMLEQVVLRALRKTPEDRFQSATDMHEALEAIVDDSIRRDRQAKFRAFLGQGQQYLTEAKWTAAIEVLTQANRLEPENEEVQAGLREARVRQRLLQLYDQALESLEAEEWEEAREYLSDVINLDPDYADGQAREQLERAAQELERARSQSDLLVWYRTGMGYFRRQQWILAIGELKQVSVLDPGFKDTADRLAEARRYARADRLFEQSQRHIRRGEWEEAVDLLGEVELLEPPHIDVAQELAYAMDKWAGVREERQLDEWYEVGVAAAAAGNLGLAKTNFEKILEKRRDYEDVADRLRDIKRQLDLDQLCKQAYEHKATGEWEQAIAVCREILAVDSLNQQAIRCLVKVQRLAKREELWTRLKSKLGIVAQSCGTPSAQQQFSWRRFVMMGLITGGPCAVVAAWLVRNLFDLQDSTRLALLLLFFLLTFVSLSCLFQWRRLARHKSE